MSSSFSISFIGAGNLAWNLAPAFENAGHNIVEISSLHSESAQSLANSLYSTKAKTDSDFSSSEIDFLFLAVKDDVIGDLTEEIISDNNTILLHCSGNTMMDVLSKFKGPYGVFYPLQTFSKAYRVNFSDIPICIESYDPDVEKKIGMLAKSISKNVSFISSGKRKAIHMAAVFANNFTNHMLAQSSEILNEMKIDPRILRPLCEETIRKAFELDPDSSQTGPARRGDLKTIREHLEKLDDWEDSKGIYELLSNQILRKYNS